MRIQKNNKSAFRKRISVHIRAFAIIICLIAGLWPLQAKAAGERIVCTLVKENSIYIYIQGISEVQSGTAQIQKSACAEGSLSVGKLADLDIPVRTVILIDNSQSISASYHEPIQEILTGLIDEALEKEEFKIGTMSDTVTYLCDYTSDKEILKQIAAGLEYHDQDTYLSNILYEEISAMNQENSGIFTRIIVIADGADNKTAESGRTVEEVYKLLAASGYPIYTIGTKEKNNDSQLTNLYAFSRETSSESYQLDGSSETSAIIEALSENRNSIICIRINPDDSLLDGREKAILLKLSTAEGEVELRTEAEMPFGEAVLQEDEKKEEPKEQGGSDTENGQGTGRHVISPSGDGGTGTGENGDEDKSIPMALIVGIIAAFIILVGIIILLLFLRKKKTETATNGKGQSKADDPNNGEIKTRLLMHEKKGDGPTVLIAPIDNPEKLWKKKYILLKCREKRGEIYKEPIQDAILIGREREENNINLNEDEKVSHSHCKIILRGELLSIKDLGSLNGTFYQGRRISEETPLISGDEVQIGEYHYTVELMEE